jgi:hypothetical protein
MKDATERSELLEWSGLIRRFCEERGVPEYEPMERPVRDPNAPRVKYVLTEFGKRMRRELAGPDRNAAR